ncbi:type I restriction endonuclease subunit R [Massilia sp. SM-13]|uniref:type I restriction endonuclease subunit R n=1 Tax=Pseudoduganella rhizocola TaxID=3382643 RepID=UPI0038B5D569
MSKFNEDTRVKIPALLHLTRLRYEYLSLKNSVWDTRNNIFGDIFAASISRLNPGVSHADIRRTLEDIQLDLLNDDLGKAFHKRLTTRSGLRLIEFDDVNQNSFHVVTELPFVNGGDEFRPDITLLVNGLPLAFVEVKKPMNTNGVLAERERMNRRHANSKFRHFFNLVQLMVFSNNQEYDDAEPEPVQGAFYAAATYGQAHFNHFREGYAAELSTTVHELSDDTENLILTDTNYTSLKHAPEFSRNKLPDTPTNRILTSLFSRERFAFILQYAFAYLDKDTGVEKHIMRYPQIFATQAIARHLDGGARKGIVWHTQGSGKTALAYYNVRFLTNWFQQRRQVARFYFIVDRLDLLKQARDEFRLRGLSVNVIESRDEFARDIKKTVAIDNDRGEPEITVVNIQKFKDDPTVTAAQDYNVSMQRVYFLDEVHRSYKPTGSFLANLSQSDRNAIHIGLTGTPLIGEQAPSKALFGNYIHTYYYNASISDGYTLRLIREDIATQYRMQLQQTLQSVQVLQGGIAREALYAHPRFVQAMLDYILQDFRHSRIAYGKDGANIGGMVICDSSEQARELYEQFVKLSECKLTAALILHNEGDKQFREDQVKAFKNGGIDLLFVYNMLLTGFDAPRLKKLYVGRIIKDHNLLQALTRVNRRYKSFRYGYVVDFADIQSEFDKANKNYYDELTAELGDEMQHYSRLFKSADEIRTDIEAIKQALFLYSLDDAELFSQQVGQVEDRDKLLRVAKALANARELYNLIRLNGQQELMALLDFDKLRVLHNEAQHALAQLNLKAQIENAPDTSTLLNQALEDVIFRFEKLGESELKLADELKGVLRRTRETLASTQDSQDPQWIALKEELERRFKKKKLSEVSQADMRANISVLSDIERKAKALNQENTNLQTKYGGDSKYLRIHKRLLESRRVESNPVKLHEALSAIKQVVDKAVLGSRQLLGNPAFFEKQTMPIIIGKFQESLPISDVDTFDIINQLLVKEYLGQAQSKLNS